MASSYRTLLTLLSLTGLASSIVMTSQASLKDASTPVMARSEPSTSDAASLVNCAKVDPNVSRNLWAESCADKESLIIPSVNIVSTASTTRSHSRRFRISPTQSQPSTTASESTISTTTGSSSSLSRMSITSSTSLHAATGVVIATEVVTVTSSTSTAAYPESTSTANKRLPSINSSTRGIIVAVVCVAVGALVGATLWFTRRRWLRYFGSPNRSDRDSWRDEKYQQDTGSGDSNKFPNSPSDFGRRSVDDDEADIGTRSLSEAPRASGVGLDEDGEGEDGAKRTYTLMNPDPASANNESNTQGSRRSSVEEASDDASAPASAAVSPESPDGANSTLESEPQRSPVSPSHSYQAYTPAICTPSTAPPGRINPNPAPEEGFLARRLATKARQEFGGAAYLSP